MKKISVILIILLLIGFGTYKNIQSQKAKAEREQAKIEKQMKNIDFHNYPVKNDTKQISKNTIVETINTTETPKSITPKKIIGDRIPDWVYENTSSNDRYYSLIHSQRNFVFTSYANCSIGQSLKRSASSAISKADANSKFDNKVELMAQGTSIVGTCSKTYKGNTCYAKQSEINEGTCKCAIHYILDNCGSNYCIINPKQRRIVIVEQNEQALIAKLKELKNNW